MSQKLYKLLNRYAKKTGNDYDSIKKEYQKLDAKSKARLLSAIRNLFETSTYNRPKILLNFPSLQHPHRP